MKQFQAFCGLLREYGEGLQEKLSALIPEIQDLKIEDFQENKGIKKER